MILYYIVKFYTKIVFRLYYRKIYVKGLENIPKDKPVLICSNHPSGFIEPLMIGHFMKEAIYFLVRGDLFEQKVLGWFLRNSHQIPIYRKKDGFKNLRSNGSTMDWINNALKNHKQILLFPEGGTDTAKYLRPLQKGVARMAFDFHEEYPDEDLVILPISMNFTYYYRVRSEVTISFMPPIRILDYKDDYKEHKARTYRKLLDKLKDVISERLIKVEDENDAVLYEKLAPLFRKSMQETSISVVSNSQKELEQELELSDVIRNTSSETKLKWNSIIDSINSHRRDIGIDSFDYNLKENSFIDYVLLILGFVPAMIGKLFHYIPSKIATNMADKHDKDGVFWASLVISVSIGTYTVYYVLAIIIASIFFGYTGVICIFLLAFMGWLYLHYNYFAKRFQDRARWSNYADKDKISKQQDSLRKMIFST